jgi:hypothetical protein
MVITYGGGGTEQKCFSWQTFDPTVKKIFLALFKARLDLTLS